MRYQAALRPDVTFAIILLAKLRPSLPALLIGGLCESLVARSNSAYARQAHSMERELYQMAS